MKRKLLSLGHRFLILAVVFFLTVVLLVVMNRSTAPEPDADRSYVGLSGETYREYTENWDALYDTPQYVYGKEPSRFLREHVHLLPRGRALDIAMGEGRNAVYLAKKGFRVDGVDLSAKALAKASKLAKENGVAIHPIRASLRTYAIEQGAYDVILNINFLMRDLIPRIRAGLKSGGVVVFENLTTDQLQTPGAQLVPRDQMLEPGELRKAFDGFEILVYREAVEDNQAKAFLVARKP